MLEKLKKSKLLAGIFIVLIVILGIVGTKKISFAIGTKDLKDGELVLNVTDGQKIDLKAKKVKCADVLKSLSEKTGVEIKVQEGVENQLVSASFKDLSLQDAIKRIVGNNYVLAMRKTDNGFEVVKGNIVSIKDQIKEFAGSFMEDDGLIKMFFMPPDSSPESDAAYIKERHKLLDHLAEKYPNKVVKAQISLKDFLTVNEISAILDKRDVKVKVINDGWEDWGGYFDVREGESFQDAIPRLNESEEIFFGHMGEEASGSKQEYYMNFKEKGVMIYGLEIEGKVKDLKGFKDDIEQVRLMDPLWKGNLFSLLEKTHIVHPIAIPLNPFTEPVSELEK